MLNIKYKKINKESIEYIGNTDLTPKSFEKTMKDICEDNNVSIFWELKKSGEFFISLNFCEAKICSGHYTDNKS